MAGRLPILYHTEAEVTERRAQYLAALDELVAAVKAPDVARAVYAAAVGTSQPFFLPYQGQNDREPQAVFGQLICGLLAGTKTLAVRPKTGERIRLGIVSGFFHDHTIFRLFLEGWLTELDRERFEVTVFHTGPTSDPETTRTTGLCDRFVSGIRSAAAWRDAASGTAPHVLLYPEVGMDPVAARLAAHRLAPVQCVAWGHPETTGMPTIDAFLSADLMEPPDGDAHYTEQLVRLKGLGVHYTPDAQTSVPPLDRRSLVLDPSGLVDWSGQALVRRFAGGCDEVFLSGSPPRLERASSSSGRAREKRRGDLRHFASGWIGPSPPSAWTANQHCVILPPMPQQPVRRGRWVGGCDPRHAGLVGRQVHVEIVSPRTPRSSRFLGSSCAAVTPRRFCAGSGARRRSPSHSTATYRSLLGSDWMPRGGCGCG